MGGRGRRAFSLRSSCPILCAIFTPSERAPGVILHSRRATDRDQDQRIINILIPSLDPSSLFSTELEFHLRKADSLTSCVIMA